MINETPYSKITLKTLRDFILDKNVTENDKIILHTLTFDDIVLEHRGTYSEPIAGPFFFLGVHITEDRMQKIRIDQIKITRG